MIKWIRTSRLSIPGVVGAPEGSTRAQMPKSESLMPPECESRMFPWCRA